MVLFFELFVINRAYNWSTFSISFFFFLSFFLFQKFAALLWVFAVLSNVTGHYLSSKRGSQAEMIFTTSKRTSLQSTDIFCHKQDNRFWIPVALPKFGRTPPSPQTTPERFEIYKSDYDFQIFSFV